MLRAPVLCCFQPAEPAVVPWRGASLPDDVARFSNRDHVLATLLMAVYFGDLHIHTAISSDAVGDPALLFEVARNEEDLDFIAITDHDTTMDAAEWVLTRDLAKAANVPGVFVAFSGIEWTYGVHINVYFLGDDEPFCPTCNDLPRFDAFYGKAVRELRAGAQINHPNNQGPFSTLDDSVLRNVEIWNGRSHATDQEGGALGALALLAQGHRLGFIGTSDDHSFTGTGESARRLGDTLTGCHAEELTRASILEALRSRRCFATDNLRTVVDIDVAGTLMGGATQLCQDRAHPVHLMVAGTATPSRVEIVQDGVVVASRTNCTSPSCDLSAQVVAYGPFSNVYGRVFHAPGTGCVNCKTWTSPVKVFASVDPGACSAGVSVPSMGRPGFLLMAVGLVISAVLALGSRRFA